MDLTAALPLELKLAIAASVNRAELLSLAQVSRVWRDTSHIDDRFYLKVVAGIASNMEDSILQLQSLLSAIDHAKCYRRTLGIHLELLHHSWIERGDHQRSISAHVTSIMQAVSQSMEHVAILRVHASTDHETYILSSLARSRAPILRRFSMDVQRYEDKTFWGPMLFQGLAPSLRRIDLRGFSVGECPVPAFRHVHKVYVEFAKVIQRQPSSNNFAVVFPELRRLRVTFADLGIGDTQAGRVTICLHPLQYLSVADIDARAIESSGPIIQQAHHLNGLAAVRLRCIDSERSNVVEALVSHCDGELFVKIYAAEEKFFEADVCVAIYSRSPPSRRVFVLKGVSAGRAGASFPPLRAALQIAPQIVELHISADLMMSCFSRLTELPVTQVLCIYRGYQWDTWRESDKFTIHCPTLKSLHLRAVSIWVDGRRLNVSLDVLSRLAVKLGQSGRPPEVWPVCVLHGMVLSPNTTPVPHGFSALQLFEDDVVWNDVKRFHCAADWPASHTEPWFLLNSTAS